MAVARQDWFHTWRRLAAWGFLGVLAATGCGPKGDGGPAPAEKMSESRSPVEGVWQIVDRLSLSPDGKLETRPIYESLWIFTRGYYSVVYTRGDAPRVPFVEELRPTEAEKLAAFDSLVVNAGTYEISGSVLVTHPQVARIQDFVGGRAEFEWRLEGDAMFLERVRSFNAAGEPIQVKGQSSQLHLKRLE